MSLQEGIDEIETWSQQFGLPFVGSDSMSGFGSCQGIQSHLFYS